MRRAGDRIHLSVRVTPRAAVTAVGGEREGHLLVRVTAAPTAGAANAAVVRALARALEVAPSTVRIEHGSAARIKRVSIPSSAAARLAGLAR